MQTNKRRSNNVLGIGPHGRALRLRWAVGFLALARMECWLRKMKDAVTSAQE